MSTAEENKDEVPAPVISYEVEKFPEYIQDSDDSLFVDYTVEGSLQKLTNLSKCQFNERLTYAKHLADLLLLIGDAGTDHLKDILTTIAQDNEDIKRVLLAQLPQIIDNFSSKPQGYPQIRDIITPTLFQLIGNDNLDVKEDAGKILAKIGYLMEGDDRSNYILNPVLKMAHDDQIDDNRIVAIQLLTRMADCLGPELCEKVVGTELLILGEDPQTRVRKESVLNLPSICKQVSTEYFQNKLLPFFVKKSQDNQWVIRKACVETIVEIAKVTTKKFKENELTDIFLNFLKDQQKWVKTSAFKNLGPFIVTLENCNASEKLFDQYLKMTDASINNLNGDNEIMISCAQFFPAVLKVYGEKKWSILQPTFQILLKSGIIKVKKPIACCLHEIAQILGQEKAEKDLFPVLESIISDANDEVKQGTISHLAEFINVFESKKRDNFVDVFLILQKDPKKWRIRELLAKQIDNLARMFNSETIFLYIMPISFKLCNDTVAIVREEAAKKVHSILLELEREVDDLSEANLANLVDHIRAFSISHRYYQRQTFIAMVYPLMMYPNIFKKWFEEVYKTLATDKVVNVRIVLATMISQHIAQNGPLANDPIILEIVDIFKKDKSRDVRSFFIKDVTEGVASSESTDA